MSKNKQEVYVVTMYRWGDRENHSYVLGAFTTKTRAEKAASTEIGDRGGKYLPEILEIPFNINYWDNDKPGFKEILKLQPHPYMLTKAEFLTKDFNRVRGK